MVPGDALNESLKRGGVSVPPSRSALADAVDGRGVFSLYQPIVDLRRGVVCGYEALVRFAASPATGPDTWFAFARARGQLARLEAAALRSALAARPGLPPNTFLSVNVGPDVLEAPEIRDVWDDQDLRGVVVELTEHARVDCYAELQPALERLRAAGALIAIDDAGAGYSGLQHLLTVRPDMVKLDRSLVTGVHRDEAKRALIEMIGDFASRLDTWVLAEGVETRAELDTLARLGVPLAQGYYLARPGPGWARIHPVIGRRLRSLAAEAEGLSLRELLEGLDAPGVHTADPSVCAVMNVDTPLAEAAHRVITRPLTGRFGPVLCTDDAGRIVGLVRIERLIDSLANALED